MDDPFTERLTELLQITALLCRSINELIGGLNRQLAVVSDATAQRRTRTRRRARS
jgi:hypothetical protein